MTDQPPQNPFKAIEQLMPHIVVPKLLEPLHQAHMNLFKRESEPCKKCD